MPQIPPVTRHAALPQLWAAASLTVVMPTYNEVGSLAATCEHVLSLPLPRLRVRRTSPRTAR